MSYEDKINAKPVEHPHDDGFEREPWPDQMDKKDELYSESTQCPLCASDKLWSTTGAILNKHMCMGCGHCWGDLTRDENKWRERQLVLAVAETPNGDQS